MNRITKSVLWVVLLIILAFYPQLFGFYFTNIFVVFAIFALFAVSFNMLLGYTGLLSFGHAMFFGTGGYATAIALERIQGLPLLPAILIGLLAAIVLALILCPLLVRVSGVAFAMLTLAFGQLLHVLAMKLRWLTGGEDGVGGFPIPPFNIPGIVSIDIADPIKFYYFAMVVLGISIWTVWFITKTPFGSIQVGIRDNPVRVDYLGFKVPQTKAIILIMSSGFAGIAGSIYALFQNLISADDAYHVGNSFAPIIMTVVGGVGSFFGPIIGSGILSIIDEMTSRYTERVDLVTGLILILMIMFAPGGLASLFGVIKEKWSGKKSDKAIREGDS
ncbi:MAG: branched-chain amino acid ABC transporter permease [Deltaproteobacteria bacterium]|nr:branched-chain amino acid ABC transporter permease [Deltaproteobacteria bacterium]MBW2050104.1 branched-chain amino acid ABC transporter permease [Deltaproteobacteria bacterium]HDH99033.1 branched-chain amino acid ABC transporter permease [Deltaproteobacteria bacterium]